MDIDKMLEGDGNTSDPKSGTATAEPKIEPLGQRPDEEVEFSKLTGSSRDRFTEMYRRAKEAENKLAQQQTYVPPAPQSRHETDLQNRQVLEQLDNAGVATKDFTKAQLSEATNQIRWELKQNSLGEKYKGENGEPKYERELVEDYIRNHSQYQYYDPEDVFKYKMYPDEFENMKAQNQTQRPHGSTSLKPNKAQTRQDALTPEYIEERLKQSDGDAWYDANKDEINKVVYNHTQQFKGQNFGGM